MKSYFPALLLFTFPLFAQQPTSVTAAGSFQAELGCPGDWQPDCAATHLTYDAADDVWQGAFTVPTGAWEYKAALDNSWDENYGANATRNGANIAFSLGAPIDVRFYYDRKTNWITDSVTSRIVTAAGSFQSELGCPGDWQPDCLRSWLQDTDGDGIYLFTTRDIPAGNYETKAAINEAWDENYGQDGVFNGANIAFTVPADGTEMTFRFDSFTNVLTVQAGETPGYAIIHYNRPAGDYGDHTTGNYNDFWGLHLWGNAIDPAEATDWTAPKPFLGETEYGRFAFVKLSGSPGTVNFIIHRGDTKDTDGDRSFDPAVSPEIWLQQGDTGIYASRAAAQGYVTIRYKRFDGNYGVGAPDYWGLHLWSDGGNNAIDPAAETAWGAPRPADGVDDYGAFFNVPLNAADPDAVNKPLYFIVHKPSGDNTAPGGDREPGGDRLFIPAESASVWLVEQDIAVYTSRGAAEDFAVIHYRRPGNDYGDFASLDYNDFWGLHVWDGAAAPTAWPDPIRPAFIDSFGPAYRVDLVDNAGTLAYILHRGDAKDPGPDQFLDLSGTGHEVWQLQDADPEKPYVYPLENISGGNPGNINEQRAYWVNSDTIAWSQAAFAADSFTLVYAPAGGLAATTTGIAGGASIPLFVDPGGLPADVRAKFPHLANLPTLKIDAAYASQVPDILKGQIAVSQRNADGLSVDATGLQIPGVLDALYTYNGDLGLTWSGAVPSLAVWAPTAKSVGLQLFPSSDPNGTPTVLPMTNGGDGVWRITGDASWKNRFYRYDVEVFVHRTGQVEHNLVTDPYSISLAENSLLSQIIDFDDPALKPAGWDGLAKQPLAAPEDITIYELHVRDFSIGDPSVPAAHRGKFKAFTYDNTNGMNHLLALREAGLSHVHLLPAFDIGTVEEDETLRQEPDQVLLASYPADSELQQEEVARLSGIDGFNWGYDPYHYNVPEGSYSTDPDGPARVLEFREMVQSLSEKGFRVVMDVVYNHTISSGQNLNSVLDRIVPGYYHRLNDRGYVENSSCCDNTAAEHAMFEKFMIDSVLMWAQHYKVDSFRFDLMSLHFVPTMTKIRDAVEALTVAEHGVDGSSIYLYGEGWQVGELAFGARGPEASQFNMGGTGIGTFSDRIRNAVRGGAPFDSGDNLKNQGFANGLFTDPNDHFQGDQYTTLLALSDHIRISMAGNLRGYQLVDRFGNLTYGDQIDYNGQGAGYTLDPQELVSYISKHDNQTLYDVNTFGLPYFTPMSERVRAQIIGLATVALGQGVPFFHAGSDMLRSKSLDRDSFNSGDWFNKLDFTYADNNFGVGLPVAEKNFDNWFIMRGFLSNPDFIAGPADIQQCAAMFRELIALRYSSPLFRLRTADEIIGRVSFHNTGPSQQPGLIIMSVSDETGADLDPEHELVTALINADNDPKTFGASFFAGRDLALSPIQANGVDARVKTATFDSGTGTFTIPGRTAAVFVQGEPTGPFAVTVQIPIAGEVDIRYGDQNLTDGQSFTAEEGRSLQWRLSTNGFNSAWKSYTPERANPVLAVTEADYCNMTVDIPIAGAEVDIRYGPQNLATGDTVTLPKGINIQWRLSVNGFNSGWKTQVVDGGCAITVTDADYCDVSIAIPIAGAEVDIRYGPQNLTDGSAVFLPKGINIQWRLSVNGFNSAWKTQAVDGGCAITVTEADYCAMAVTIPIAEAEVDIRYGPQNLADGSAIFLPKGINVQWRLSVNGFNSGWKTQAVNGTCSVAVTAADYCNTLIDLPNGGELDIRYGPQNLADSDTVDLPKGINVQWRLNNGPWQTYTVGDPCTITAP